MAEKRYYWLKLKENYFDSPKIKKLRKIAGGDTYTIIYLKMQLLSISNGGIITYEDIEPTFEEEIALKLDEQLEDVQLTLAYLKQQLLIEANNEQFLLPEACNNIGSECQSAERVRLFRKKNDNKMLQCNESVTQVKRNSISISNSISNSNSMLNKEENKIKEEKHKYGEYKHILLTDGQYNKLVLDYGQEKTDEAIKYADEYVQYKGYKCKDWNLALRKWGFKAIEERKEKSKEPTGLDAFKELEKKYSSNKGDDVIV